MEQTAAGQSYAALPPKFQAMLAQMQSDPRFRRSLLKDAIAKLGQVKLQDYEPNEKQREFHAAGPHFKERALVAGNRLGKSLAGGFEDAMHATGEYPSWWTGKVFEGDLNMWIASESIELTRDGVQKIVAGPADKLGTGAIPAARIKDRTLRSGVVGAIDTLFVRRGGGGDVQGDDCSITFKSYDQGRAKFQAAAVHVVHLDEEPDLDIYTEALTRTVDTRGILMLTATPLKGLTPLMRKVMFERTPSMHVTVMTLDDVTHFTAEEKRAIAELYPEHERDARLRGIPTIGEGGIYPVSQSAIECDPFPIPAHWRWLMAVDFGWDHPFAWVLLAYDPDTDTIYVTDCFKESKKLPADHVNVIRARHPDKIDWCPVAWPADGNQTEKGSGIQLKERYISAGLKGMRISHATWPRVPGQEGQEKVSATAVEPGLTQIHERMQTGRFRVFRTLRPWFEEMRTYHRAHVTDKSGVLSTKIVKAFDDLMDATRYGVMDLRYAITKPVNGHNKARANGYGRGAYNWQAGA